MSPKARLWAVWAVLGLGLWLILEWVPMPGVKKPPPPAVPTALAQPTPLIEGSFLEQFGQGLIALKEGRREAALACMDRAIALDPSDPAPRVQKAFALASGPEADPVAIRALLAEASERGFDRAKGLERIAKALGDGSDRSPEDAPLLLQRAVLLGFSEPVDLEGARKSLAEASAAGAKVPESLKP